MEEGGFKKQTVEPQSAFFNATLSFDNICSFCFVDTAKVKEVLSPFEL
jgi:hypothetical protein